MELTLTTPALLFPALSLLLLAYTSRFLTLANLIRELHRRYQTEPDPAVAGQLVIWGGYSTTVQSDLWAYDPVSNAWTELTMRGDTPWEPTCPLSPGMAGRSGCWAVTHRVGMGRRRLRCSR